MRLLRQLLVCVLIGSVVAFAQGNSFEKVRYNGGSVDSKVGPKDWNNRLTVTSDMITLALKDGGEVQIPPKSVTALSYGQEAHRRVGTMIALAVLVAPVALFGLFHKTRLHYIGVQYTTSDGKAAGILLQGHKDNYRAMLVALQGVTRVPVSVGDKDREFLPVGVTAQTVKSEGGENAEKTAPQEGASAEAEVGVVNVISTPTGGDVLVDGEFVGNCPAALKLKPGKHTITVKRSGFKDWSREMNVQSGSNVQLAAALENEG